MITIRFTQCARDFELDDFSKEMTLWPVIPRVELYKKVLLDHAPLRRDTEFSTLDELFILVAQKLHRDGRIKVKFVSVCGCFPVVFDNEREIALDEEGDMLEDPHHGFFGQRLPLLR